MPYKIFGYDMGGPAALIECGIGYSNVLFGIMFLEAFMDSSTHGSYFGIRLRKTLVPFLYLAVIQLCFPEASLWGHLCGILAAVFLKYG